MSGIATKWWELITFCFLKYLINPTIFFCLSVARQTSPNDGLKVMEKCKVGDFNPSINGQPHG